MSAALKMRVPSGIRNREAILVERISAYKYIYEYSVIVKRTKIYIATFHYDLVILMKAWGIPVVLAVFLAGFLCGNVVVSQAADLSYPLYWFGYSQERASPSNWVAEESIHVYQDRIVIDLEDAYWAKFVNTNSMDPLLDEESNALQIKPASPSQIRVGDIITYSLGDSAVIHRVIETGVDESGWFAITKGDNNAYADPAKVRFDQVERVLVAIIY
ncbi:signal peptidase I [Candidatus Woesearchaeota archaeon]|nr:signal peptidase I [Candidatus Woesearchaeota archaeon]